MRPGERVGDPARHGARLLVAEGEEHGPGGGDDRDLREPAHDRARVQRLEVLRARTRAGVVGHHGTVALGGEHHGGRGPPAVGGHEPDALELERLPEYGRLGVGAQGAGEHGVEPEAGGADGGYGATAGGAVQVLRVALLTRSRQRVEPGERQVEERRRGDGEVGHPKRSWSSGSRARYSSKMSRAVVTEGTRGWRASALTASAREPVSAASIVARSTALTDCTSAWAWSATGPTATGCGPDRPTIAGTSTTARASRKGSADRFAVLQISVVRV